MNNMPQMPGMPKLDLSSGGSDSHAEPLSPSFADGEGEKSPSPDVGLDVPSHEDEKPKLIRAEEDVSTQVKAPSPSKGRIEVVATRKGFYNQERKAEGSKFFIKSEEEFGEWFKCVEKHYEEKRRKFLEFKKKAK